MGCLLLGFAAVLSLAMPAAIARTSLVGAYVVIVVLAALAVAGVVARARRRAPGAVPRRGVTARIGALAVVYAGVVTAVHFVR